MGWIWPAGLQIDTCALRQCFSASDIVWQDNQRHLPLTVSWIFFHTRKSEGVGLMTAASVQMQCITCPITTLNYFKGFSVTFGNPDICDALSVIEQSFPLLLFNRKNEITSLA